MARALGVHQFLASKKKVMPFEGEWLNAFGCPEFSGSWIIWGTSGSGKTSFALQLCKYLAQFGKVYYNSLEEGVSASLQRGFRDVQMQEVARRVTLLDRESMAELSKRLVKTTYKFVLIDSFQYTGMSYADYKKLREANRDKLFIFISHAEGKEPAGRAAKSVRYDCDCKIRVEGYRANVVSRYGGGTPYTIWEQGAAAYWGNEVEHNNNK